MEPLERYGRPEVVGARTGFMNRVYLWMTFGLFTTGYTSYMTAHSEVLRNAIFGNPFLFYGLLILEVLMVFGLSGLMNRISAFAATVVFFLYALLNGLTMSFIFMIYAHQTIGLAFGITGGMFAGLSLFGMVTKKDLGAMGTFMFSALIGLILAMVVNMFLHNPLVDWVISMAAVVIFSGLTAYDTQKLKRLSFDSDEAQAKGAIYGALTLYLDFVNLFLNILRLMGGSGSRR